MKKKTIKVSIIYTVCFIIIYDGMVGLTLAEKWDSASPIAAFLGNILGGNDLYPMDIIQKIAFLMLFIEIILMVVFKSKNDSQEEIKEANDSTDEYKDLEKLKELLDKGIITEADFNKKKEELLKRI